MHKETSKLLSTTAFLGTDSTPDTIKTGTVRMEDHPDYPAVLAMLHRKQVELVTVDVGHPYVEIVRHIEGERRETHWRLVCRGSDAVSRFGA